MSDSPVSAVSDSFNNVIAITAAVMTCCLALSNIENGKLSDQSRDAQIMSVSVWNQYQGKRVRQYLLENSITNAVALRTQAMGSAVDRAIVDWQAEADRYGSEMEELATTAKAHEAEWRNADRLSGMFSLSESFLTVCLAGLAISALVRKRWLFGMALTTGALGIAYAAGGLFGLTSLVSWSG